MEVKFDNPCVEYLGLDKNRIGRHLIKFELDLHFGEDHEYKTKRAVILSIDPLEMWSIAPGCETPINKVSVSVKGPDAFDVWNLGVS